MTRLSKTLLAVTITGLVAGSIIDFGEFNLNPAWTVAMPFGAICYGLFLISFMLEKEVAKFDEDEEKELRLIRDSYAAPTPKSDWPRKKWAEFHELKIPAPKKM